MSRYPGIPVASVVSLLLFLCFTHSGLGENCIFTHKPLSTTPVSTDGLKKQMLLDYPVSQPSNLLKSDEHCLELWQLHFISRELSRMVQVAGSELRENISDLERRLNLSENCKLTSDCVDFERTNVSVFLDSIPSIVKAMANKMEHSLDFSGCTPVRCQPDSLSTPYTYSAQQLENPQTSKSAILRRHHWLLIPALLVCLFSVVKFSGRVPFQPLPFQV